MTRIAMRPLSVGEILDRSFQVLRLGFVPLFLTALIGTVPLLLVYLVVGLPYGTFAPADPALAPGAGFAFVFLLVALATLVTYALVWGALAWQVDRLAAGHRITVGEGVKAGASSMMRLIGAGIVLYLFLFGAIIVLGIGMGVMIPFASAGAAGPAVIVGFLVTMGLFAWMLVRWVPVAFITLPPVVLDGAGPIEGVRRANALSKGGRTRLCVIAFLAWLLVVLPYVALPIVLGMGAAMWDPAAAGTATTTQYYLYQVLSFAVGAVTTPFLAAAMVFAYHDRRARREAPDLDLTPEPARV